MRGLGKGVHSFKQGMNEVEEEIKKPIDKENIQYTNLSDEDSK